MPPSCGLDSRCKIRQNAGFQVVGGVRTGPAHATVPLFHCILFDMPNTASAKKRLRQNEVRRLHNRTIKSAVRTQIKKVRQAVDAGEIDKAEAEFRAAAKKLDQAGAKRVIHPNKSARQKSRLQALIRKAKTASSS